jgi:hypothetical protein
MADQLAFTPHLQTETLEKLQQAVVHAQARQEQQQRARRLVQKALTELQARKIADDASALGEEEASESLDVQLEIASAVKADLTDRAIELEFQCRRAEANVGRRLHAELSAHKAKLTRIVKQELDYDSQMEKLVSTDMVFGGQADTASVACNRVQLSA